MIIACFTTEKQQQQVENKNKCVYGMWMTFLDMFGEKKGVHCSY